MENDNDNILGRAPACDSCRSRKIKCDREVPCSSCRSWKITCQTTARARERKQRLLITHKYENEFRNLDRKLESLSVTLQSFVDNAKPGEPASTQALHTQVADVLASVKQEHDEDEALFQGESSFPAQSNAVAQIYGDALKTSPSTSGNSSSLDTSNETGISPGRSGASKEPCGPNPDTLSANFPQLAKLPLPPATAVLNVLRIAKAQPQKVFIDFPFLNVDLGTTMCQKVYFPTEDYTLATYIAVNAVLYYLFRDLENSLAEKISLMRSDLTKYVDLCGTNVYVAMKFWNLATEPSHENIQAIVLGSFILMENCHMFRTWTCIGFATRLLQDAGFHRQQSLEGLSVEERRFRKWLFWTAYSFDHALSLNFGRPANIQDYDITVELPDFPPEADVHGQQILFWIDLSRLHGQIYERLYSARAVHAAQEIRTAAALELAAVTIDLKEQFQPFYAQLAQEDYARGATTATQVVLYSTLTLIYKCIPAASASGPISQKPLQVCDECITAARTSLTMLNASWGGINKTISESWRIFVHWSLLGSPFVPFLVIFGNAMNMPNNLQDFQLLQESCYTITDAARLSKGLLKLNEVCQNFLRVAKAKYEHLEQTFPMSNTPSTQAQSEIQVPISIPPEDAELGDNDPLVFNFMDFSMLDGWELGPGGAESAREMNSYFEQFPSTTFMGPPG